MQPWWLRLLTGADARAAWRALLWLLVAAVLWLALSPQPPDLVTTGWDKSNHVLAFAVLAAVAAFAHPDGGRPAVVQALVLLALAAAIEGLQMFVPGRAAEWTDFAAGVVGVATGAPAARWLLRRLPRPHGARRGGV